MLQHGPAAAEEEARGDEPLVDARCASAFGVGAAFIRFATSARKDFLTLSLSISKFCPLSASHHPFAPFLPLPSNPSPPLIQRPPPLSIKHNPQGGAPFWPRTWPRGTLSGSMWETC